VAGATIAFAMRSPTGPSKKTTWRLACAVIGPLILAPALRAQTLPLPTLPPEQTREAGPTPGTAPPAPERPRRWEYGLGVGAGYDSNIDFRVPDGPSSWAISPRGDFSRVFRSPRGELRLGGAGSWVGYPEEKDLNRYNVDAVLDGSYRSSLNTSWRASASYGFGYGDSSWVLSEQGVLLPRVKTWTVAGSLGVTRKLGQRTSFRLDGRIYRTEFDEAEEAAIGLVNGQSLRGTAALERKLGSRDSTAIEYSLEATLARPVSGTVDGGNQYYLTHFGSLQWSHLLSPRSGFLLEAGASYTPDAAEAGLDREESFYGGATFSRQVKRSSILLFARREVTPAFGLGVSLVENRFGLTANIPMGRSWWLYLMGIHVVSETPEDTLFSYGTPDEAWVALGWRFARSFEISGEGRYRRRSAAGTFPEIEAYQAGIYLSLVNPDRVGPAARLPAAPSGRR
jgi:hypothetical protein